MEEKRWDEDEYDAVLEKYDQWKGIWKEYYTGDMSDRELEACLKDLTEGSLF